ncbi:MAG: hypothetical protein R2932_59430 [Caldilineaceae bacterium]
MREHYGAVGRDYDEIVKSWSCESVTLAPTQAQSRRRAAATPTKITPLSVTAVAEQLQAFLDIGVTYLIVRLVDFPQMDGLQLFVDEVMLPVEVVMREDVKT